jgi:hypothetical protein
MLAQGLAHWVKVKDPNAPAVKLEAEEDWGRNRIGGTQRAGIFVVLIGALLLGGCAAKQKEGSTLAASDTGTNAAGPPLSPNNVDRARDEYDRAVIDYQNCLLDNTANLSACERQRAAMNAAATILFGPPNKKSAIVNEGR